MCLRLDSLGVDLKQEFECKCLIWLVMAGHTGRGGGVETRKGRQPTQGVLRAGDFEGPLGLSATGDIQEMYRACLRVIPPKG